jgi:hypothetical protein
MDKEQLSRTSSNPWDELVLSFLVDDVLTLILFDFSEPLYKFVHSFIRKDYYRKYHIFNSHEQLINKIAARGHVKLLQWMTDFLRIRLSRDVADKAAKHGQLEIIKYLYEKKEPLYQSMVLTAVLYGQFELIKWFHSIDKGYISSIPLHKLSQCPDVDTIKFFFIHKYLLVKTSNMLIIAPKLGHFEVWPLYIQFNFIL